MHWRCVPSVNPWKRNKQKISIFPLSRPASSFVKINRGRSLIETHTIASLHNIFVAMFFDRQKKKFVGNGDSHK
jgi:hypothetical protein